MFTKIYWLENFPGGGALGIMPKPRGNDWLADEIRKFQESGIGTIVSLLEKAESIELGLADEEQLCRSFQIDYLNFPIKDRGIPVVNRQLLTLTAQVRKKLLAGEKIVLHCRMGIGRSSIIAGTLMLDNYPSVSALIDRISGIRGLKVPDTEEQVQWLTEFSRINKM